MTVSLPDENTPWPPKGQGARYGRIARNDAWYSGDPARLRAAYSGSSQAIVTMSNTTVMNPGGGPSRTITRQEAGGSVATAFWGPRASVEADTRRHLPTPEDIARISADLLMAEPPQITVDGPMEKGADGVMQPAAATRAAQKRLDTILARCNFHATLLAAAEIASAIKVIIPGCPFRSSDVKPTRNGQPP